jgi:hypothetical protein
MGNKGWLSKEDLRQKISKQYSGDISMNMSYAMDARVRIPFFLRRTGCSSSVVSSVARQGQLLPSRLDSSPKLAVVRPELKLPRTVWILSSRNSSMKTSLLVDKNHCSAFRCAYTVYWISSVHYTWIVTVHFNLYERIYACGFGVCNCYFYFLIVKMLC